MNNNYLVINNKNAIYKLSTFQDNPSTKHERLNWSSEHDLNTNNFSDEMLKL